MFQKIWNLIALLIVTVLLLAACAGPAATPTSQPQPAEPTAAANPTEAPPAPAPTTEAAQATTAPSGSGQPVEIRWYIGLGTGDAPELEAPQQKVVDAFNAAHPDIHLTKEVVLYANAYETLATQVTSGNPPDIVGPVGVS
jgi:ABC-type glycerol-3-phosphate transport system substrate-binding protein